MMSTVANTVAVTAHLDRDIAALRDMGPEGRELLFDLVDDVVVGRTEPGMKALSACRYLEATGREGVEAVLMPYLHWEPQELRPAQNWQTRSLESGEHLLAHVAQGVVFTVPLQKSPLLFLSMSECSCLVGVSEDRISVAHVSFSERFGIDAALAFFARSGVPQERLYAVVSVGEWQEGHPVSRLSRVEDYTALGISADNILSFRYFADPRQTAVDTLAGVLVTTEDITLYKLSGQRKEDLRAGYLDMLAL